MPSSRLTLLPLLAQLSGCTAAELCAALGNISRATLSRQVAAAGESVVRLGGSRRARYALRRQVRGQPSRLPVYRIDAAGHGHLVAHLSPLAPQGSALEAVEALPWPLDAGPMRDGWFDGLPYPLVDMRPQGFLGRHFARSQHALLGVGDNPDHWSDDELLHVLAVQGEDQPGDWVLGDIAYQRHLDSRAHLASRLLEPASLPERYPELATFAMQHGTAGSSAGGEFPKFTAVRTVDGEPIHVIVKFSGPDKSPATQRWADLLVCEHLALETLAAELDVPAAHSKLHQYAGRHFLEVTRFDRVGAHGRRPLCSVGSLNAALLGMAGAPWPALAAALHTRQWLPATEVARVQRQWWFGRLIANTDMHEGNLAFQPGLRTAPAYDMLPMLYAPTRSGELPTVPFVPPLPLPGENTPWHQAAAAAGVFWKLCANDSRISPAFRAICLANATAIARAAPSSGAPAPASAALPK